jgi:hypothetical protein
LATILVPAAEGVDGIAASRRPESSTTTALSLPKLEAIVVSLVASPLRPTRKLSALSRSRAPCSVRYVEMKLAELTAFALNLARISFFDCTWLSAIPAAITPSSTARASPTKIRRARALFSPARIARLLIKRRG